MVTGQRPLDSASRLKLAREAKGYSAKQIAEATKLSVRSIEQLESGKLSALPSGIYRRAIVRAVAREVGLNPEQTLQEFSASYPADLPAPIVATTEPAEAPRGSSLSRLLTVVGALVPILAGVWYFTWQPHPVERRYQPLSTRRATEAWRPEIVPAGGFLEAPPAVRRPVVVTLTISSRCHLRVMADGREVLGRIVEPGEIVPIELADELLLTGDNAAAVQFSINGQAGRMLGQPGEPLTVRIGRDDYEDFLSRY